MPRLFFRSRGPRAAAVCVVLYASGVPRLPLHRVLNTVPCNVQRSAAAAAAAAAICTAAHRRRIIATLLALRNNLRPGREGKYR